MHCIRNQNGTSAFAMSEINYHGTAYKVSALSFDAHLLHKYEKFAIVIKELHCKIIDSENNLIKTIDKVSN